MQTKKYLPVGSVVLLKGASHRVIIVGFCTADMNQSSILYDYSALPYPEGLISIENILVFNHEDIDKIYYMGYSDKEEKQFKNKLIETMDKYQDENGNLKVSLEEIFVNELKNN